MSKDLLSAADVGSRKITHADLLALDTRLYENLEALLRAEADRRGLAIEIYALVGSHYDYEFRWFPRPA